ncbi:hypothetical protein, partial [Staphylococcus aureus]|uniref:hypothetical protein n=1 Tax=Staphylococcus aureus TaxID=1280 RepID=UPI0019D5E416
GDLQKSVIGTSIATNNVSWGNGQQTQTLAESQLKITCKLARPQNSEIGFLISTNSAIWGNGPQTQKLAESQLLFHASWRSSNIVELDPQFLQTM